MKNAFLQLCLVLIGVTGVHAVKLLQTSSLHVKVLPMESADRVLAIHGKDTLTMQESDGEYFLPAVEPGIWQIRIDAKAPFQAPDDRCIEVKSGSRRNTGEVWLQP